MENNTREEKNRPPTPALLREFVEACMSGGVTPSMMRHAVEGAGSPGGRKRNVVVNAIAAAARQSVEKTLLPGKQTHPEDVVDTLRFWNAYSWDGEFSEEAFQNAAREMPAIDDSDQIPVLVPYHTDKAPKPGYPVIPGCIRTLVALWEMLAPQYHAAYPNPRTSLVAFLAEMRIAPRSADAWRPGLRWVILDMGLRREGDVDQYTNHGNTPPDADLVALFAEHAFRFRKEPKAEDVSGDGSRESNRVVYGGHVLAMPLIGFTAQVDGVPLIPCIGIRESDGEIALFFKAQVDVERYLHRGQMILPRRLPIPRRTIPPRINL